jgi:ArsR family transcriptional regulator
MDPQQISSMFRAFSDPTRLRILRLLQSGECCVGDLVTVLGLPQPSVSRHLAYLREAGLAQDRKHGLWVYYSLTPAEGGFHRSLLRCLECCFAEVPELKADALRAARLRESGGCCPEVKE